MARSHSAPGCSALRTKTMTAMSTDPGSTDSGLDSDERSQTAECTLPVGGSLYSGFDCRCRGRWVSLGYDWEAGGGSAHLDDLDGRLGIVEAKNRELRVLVVLDDGEHGVAGALSRVQKTEDQQGRQAPELSSTHAADLNDRSTAGLSKSRGKSKAQRLAS